MKSRTSFFNFTAFKKDLLRFAPLWGLYTLCMVLGMMLLTQGSGNGYSFQRDLCSLPQAMNVINFAYAVVAAQLLFGDLYNSRMCNALHALPLRRECWFGTHAAAGLAFSMIPTLAGALVATCLDAVSNSMVTASWQLPWLNFVLMNLQYLFYFGLAVFCVMCVGNRLAQGLLYAIINFASGIAYWLVDTLFEPMFYGIRLEDDPFMTFMPVSKGSALDYLNMEYIRDENYERIGAWFTLDATGWTYIGICAAIGAVLLACALLLYRRRRLESAGDFMAVKALEPIFMVVFPLVAGGAFYYVTDGMFGWGSTAYLGIGMAVGYVAGRMLIERTTRVFRKKNILGLAALAVAFGAVYLTVQSDPLNWENWMPKAEEVQYVKVYSGYYAGDMNVMLQTPEEIEKALRVHEIGLNDRTVQERASEQYNEGLQSYPADKPVIMVETVTVGTVANPAATIPAGDYISPQAITLEYHLTDGSVKSRYYVIDACDEAGDILIPYFSTMEMLFLQPYLELPDARVETVAAATVEVRIDDGWGITHRIESEELILQLLRAIEADCKAGRMAQNYNFRTNSDTQTTYWINFDMGDTGEQISCYTDCENINEFLIGIGIEHRYLQDETDLTVDH